MTTTLTQPRPRWRLPLAGLAAALATGLTAGLTAGAVAVPADAAQEAAEPAPLITTDTPWRYLADDTDPGTAEDPRAWTAPAFDDSGWPAGTGGFGGKRSDSTGESPVYDTGMVARTHLLLRPDGLAQNVRTYFFRTTFDVTPAHLAAGKDLVGDAYVDDAALIFVNGREVVRHLVETDTPNLSYDSGTGGDLDFTIPAEALREGTNTLAVAVHQDRASSSDIWWSLDSLALSSAAEPDPEGPGPTRVILTPTERPATSQSFTWLATTPGETTGRVQIGAAAGGPVRTVAGGNQGTALTQVNPHFSATVTGLQPATEYRYRVGNDAAGWTAWTTFSTADPADEEFEYVYYGDAQIGLDTTWPKVVRMAEATAPDSIGSVHAGDLIDTGGNDTQWNSWFTGMQHSAATTNIFAAPGNHEYSGDKLLKSWKAHFEYPANHPDAGNIGDLAQRSVGDTDVARQYQA